jgi:hypothetical protein
MRRIVLLITVAVVVAAMVALSASTAFAQEEAIIVLPLIIIVLPLMSHPNPCFAGNPHDMEPNVTPGCGPYSDRGHPAMGEG